MREQNHFLYEYSLRSNFIRVGHPIKLSMDFDIDELLKILPQLIRENDTVKGAIITALSGVVATREDIQDVIQTMDRRFESLHQEMDKRFEALHQEMDKRFEALHQEMNQRFEMVVTEIKDTQNSVTALQQVVQGSYEEFGDKMQRVQDSIDALRDRLENPP